MRIRSKSQMKSSSDKRGHGAVPSEQKGLPSSVLLMQTLGDGEFPMHQMEVPHFTYSTLYLEGTQIEKRDSLKQRKQKALSNLKGSSNRFNHKRMTETMSRLHQKETVNQKVLPMNQLMMPPMSKEQIKRNILSQRHLQTQKHLS
jgi:hypothetical protein